MTESPIIVDGQPLSMAEQQAFEQMKSLTQQIRSQGRVANPMVESGLMQRRSVIAASHPRAAQAFSEFQRNQRE